MTDTSTPGTFRTSNQLTTTSPSFFTLSKEESGDTDDEMDNFTTLGQTKAPQLVVLPPKTHDTSRTGWHLPDLDSLAKTIETAVSSSFPNHGGSRYRSVHVGMMRWEHDTLGVEPEVNALRDVLEFKYGFSVENWRIPANPKSHKHLMQNALDFLDDFDSKDNLFILYYAGHGYINQDRQSTWACSTDANSPTVDWSHVQSLFERALSDVLVLLDCCAAVSSAPKRGHNSGVMETIAACGFEGRAPPPGEHSFTTSLIEVLEDWENVPSFSVTMLHSAVLNVLKSRRKERCINGQKMEWRSTPVYVNNYLHSRTIGIELCKRCSLIDVGDSTSIQPRKDIAEILLADSNMTAATYLDLMSISCEALDEKLKATQGGHCAEENTGLIHARDESVEHSQPLKVPHMLISIALDQDHALPNVEACRRWIRAFPGLAKHVKVEGAFDSYSSLLILSIPVVIWNKLPDNPACQVINYVTSRNLLLDYPTQKLSASGVELSRKSSPVSKMPYSSSGDDDGTYQVQWNNWMSDSQKKSFYKHVFVLLLSWHPDCDDLAVSEEVQHLQRVFTDTYNYTVKDVLIDSRLNVLPQIQANLAVANFVAANDQEDTLFIVYYAGHGSPGKSPGELRMSGRRDEKRKVAQQLKDITWNHVESNLKTTRADVLLIFDCCYASDLGRNSVLSSRSFEYLAASTSSYTRSPGRGSFTSALVWALEQLAHQSTQAVPQDSPMFTTSKLAKTICDAPGFPGHQKPSLITRDIDAWRHIILAPLLREPASTSEPTADSEEEEENNKPGSQVLSLTFYFEHRQDETDLKKLADHLKNFMKLDNTSLKKIKWGGIWGGENQQRPDQRLREVAAKVMAQSQSSTRKNPAFPPSYVPRDTWSAQMGHDTPQSSTENTPQLSDASSDTVEEDLTTRSSYSPKIPPIHVLEDPGRAGHDFKLWPETPPEVDKLLEAKTANVFQPLLRLRYWFR